MGCNCKKTSIKAPVVEVTPQISEPPYPDTKEGKLARELDELNAAYFKQYEEDKTKQNG
jgi:hypothetical protein